MSLIQRLRVRSLVGDIESEYDEYDRDADLEVSKRRAGWLEPSW
ncbi:hypothetical protein ACLBWP_14465 [Microbacterium sp. M1A1_1b]|nr:hypothetical protein [Curtobacterium sp. VKM Ac-2922]